MSKKKRGRCVCSEHKAIKQYGVKFCSNCKKIFKYGVKPR